MIEKKTRTRKKKKLVTIEALLSRDLVNEFWEDISKERPNILEAILIYFDRDENLHVNICSDLGKTTVLGMLETAKDMTLHPEDEDDDEC